MSPEFAPAFVPATACPEMTRPPSLMSAQFGPSGPLARLKASDALVAAGC
jgi:hypothetical protein